MVVRGKEFAEIHDLVGIRVIVESEKDCWAALGSIHAIWSPVQGRFKDYINSPKFNLYQSLHTTVVGLEGKPIEVQIRTQRDAPPGRVRHRRPLGLQGAGPRTPAASTTAEMAWLQRIVDWQQETIDPLEFLETLKLDLEQDEVYVFTPKGKVIALAAGLHAHRLRLRHPHRGRPPLHRRQGQRAAGPARHAAAVGRHRRDHHLQGALGRAVAGLAEDRGLAPGPQQDPPVVQPRAARGRHRDRAGGADQGPAPRGPARPEAGRLQRARAPGRGDELRRPRRPARRHRRRPRLGPVRRPAGGPRAAGRRRHEEQLPTTVGPGLRARGPGGARPSASTSRASTTSWCGCRGAARRCPATRSSASSPGAGA